MLLVGCLLLRLPPTPAHERSVTPALEQSAARVRAPLRACARSHHHRVAHIALAGAQALPVERAVTSGEGEHHHAVREGWPPLRRPAQGAHQVPEGGGARLEGDHVCVFRRQQHLARACPDVGTHL